MTGLVQQRIDLGDGHALGTLRDLHDLVAGPDLALFEDAKVEAGSVVGDEQRCHLRLVHADADPIASDARLRHFEHRAPDPVAIADAHLVVGQPIDGEILAELPKVRLAAQIAAAELGLPIAIGVDLVDKNRPLLAAVPRQIALTVAVDVETPRHAPALDGRLPDAGVDCPASPGDIARQTDIDRKQASHHLFLPASERAGLPAFCAHRAGPSRLC